jgi:P-type Ca2+ transporter type 2C
VPAGADAVVTGLTPAQVQRQRALDGPNQLPQGQPRSLGRIAAAAFLQPMFLLLLAGAVLYGAIGQASDAASLMVSLVFVLAITVTQEYRTERVLRALKDLASPRSRVLREGVVQVLASVDLVRGDHLLVAEGDRLACDARVLQAHELLVDESQLTGESSPVHKSPATGTDIDPVRHVLRAGSLVVCGDGAAIVSAVGSRTALGQVGESLAQIAPPQSRVQQELRTVVRRAALLAGLLCLSAAAVFAARQDDWVGGLLVGLTLAMSIIPEEFAVVWTVMMALGAWRMARQQVLTRQAQAIETLGATSVLCVDKTGTLTHNQMQLVAIETPDARQQLAAGEPVWPELQALVAAAALASVDDGLEPMDRAVHAVHRTGLPVQGAAAQRSMLDAGWRLISRRGIAPGRPFVLHRWASSGDPGQALVAVKGAPEAVLELCELIEPARQAIQGRADDMARSGLRVLGVAWSRGMAGSARLSETDIPPLEWMGLIGFLDPIRETVPAALQACREAGIRVVMITGDAPATARAIAVQAGLPGEPCLSGRELDASDDATFHRAVSRCSVFARVTPQHKLRIVEALQRQGERVAMTGDGVNDAMALRAADIGVAMGRRGTDVAREAASIVLLDDRFEALVEGVRLGRRIFHNLQRSVHYLIAVHVPIVAVSLLPVLGAGPVLLLPLHVVLLELIIDPACTLVVEASQDDALAMKRPPRQKETRLITREGLIRAVASGLVAALVVLAVQALAEAGQWSDASRRMAGLLSLVGVNLALLVQTLGMSALRNRALGALVVGIAAALAIVFGVSGVSARFGF